MPGTGVVGGEGEDVGDFVVATEVSVEAADGGVIDDGDGDLGGVRVGEAEGGTGGASEEGAEVGRGGEGDV